MSQVLIVGAGIAGSLAAHDLVAAGHDVVLLDKGHAPGGRVATRTVGDAVFDHGAQFLTAKSDRFARVVEGWNALGISRAWFQGSPDLGAPEDPDGFPRFRGAPTMRRIGEHLTEGLDVRLGTVVDRVTTFRSPTGQPRWRARTSRRTDAVTAVFEADALLLTAPVPQSLALLDAGGAVLPADRRTELDGIGFDPCIAVLAIPHDRPALPARGAARIDDPDITWLTDNQATGASPTPAVTIHASAAFSRAHLLTPDEEVGPCLVARAHAHFGTDADVVYVHRWRYAAPTSRAERDSVLALVDGAPVVLAGDGLAGGRVEGAALSGLDAADRLIRRLAAPTV